MSDKAILARIKNLPPLPLVAHKLVTMMQDDSCSADALTRVLSSDQALAGKILKLANSSFYGLSGQVGSVSRAVVILGHSAIRSMALGLGMAQAINKAAKNFDLNYFWRHALFVASGARTVATESNRIDPEEAFIAGLIHDLGRLILELTVPGLEAQLQGVPAEQLLDAEQEAAGMAHTKAGQQVMRHWHLPESLAQLARFHHHPTDYRKHADGPMAAVQLAEYVARILDQSNECVASNPDPVALAAHVGISLADTEDLLARTCQEVDRTRAFLEVSGVDVEFEKPLDELLRTDAPPEERGTAVYLGTDAERAGWVRGQLGIQDWQLVAMRPFLAGNAGDVDLALVDPLSITSAQATKLKAVLKERGVPLATLGDAGYLSLALTGVPVMPVAFQRHELLALAGKVTV